MNDFVIDPPIRILDRRAVPSGEEGPPPEAATCQFIRAVLDRDVLALDEACFRQALAEGSQPVVGFR